MQNNIINVKVKVSERVKRLHFVYPEQEACYSWAQGGWREGAMACLVESWELRCIMPGREDFIYGSIRSELKEICWHYLGDSAK